MNSLRGDVCCLITSCAQLTISIGANTSAASDWHSLSAGLTRFFSGGMRCRACVVYPGHCYAGQLLAGLLGWPQATFASKLEMAEDGAQADVTREVRRCQV